MRPDTTLLTRPTQPARPSRKSRPFTSQSGFTLVELTTTLVVLAVLAAVALPRYTQLGSQARVAKLESITASLRTAAAQTKATAVGNQANCGAGTVTSSAGPPAVGAVLEGRPIDLNYCYPQALAVDTGGILAAANLGLASDGLTLITTSADSAPGSALGVGVLPHGQSGNCTVTYTAPTGPHTAPQFSVVSLGC